MSNRRRHANVLPVASLATWILLAGFAAMAGLYYVYCKNQLHTRGAMIKVLEQELADLKNKNEVLGTSISKLAAPTALRARRATEKNFLAGYRSIEPNSLVVISDRPMPMRASELRAVSNPQP